MDYIKEIAALIRLDGAEDSEIQAALTPAAESAFGDYSLPCFKFSRALRKSPAEIASSLKNSLSDLPAFIEKAEAAGGYLNFTLDRAFFVKDTLEEIFEKGADFGASDEGRGKTVCIDFSSINIAKPFHIGHLGTTVIGAALYRVFKKLGYNVVGINHLGDFGTQFGKLIVAYKLWGDKSDIERRGLRALVDIYVRFHKEEESDPKLTDEAREWFLKIERGDAEAVGLFNFFKSITLEEVKKTYVTLGVHFDSYAGESFYNDKMRPVIDELKEKNLLKISGGASIVDLSEYGMPPCLILRSDGASLYATRDLATIFYRKKTYNFDKCLYVVAYQQNLHFKQVFKVVELMGYGFHKDLIHVAYGMVSLEEGAMSTRKGNMVYLSDVLDKASEKAYNIISEKSPGLKDKKEVAEAVGVGAVIFSALINNRIKDNVFSYEKILNFDGETGPYLQYTYARCNSISEKAGIDICYSKNRGIEAREILENNSEKSGIEACKISENESEKSGEKYGIEASYLTDDAAYGLVKILRRYPEVLKAAKDNYEPSYVTRYLIDTAQAFNRFYIADRVLDADKGLRAARAALTKSVMSVLKNGFEIIGIKPVDHM
ncbi:MAG: arginine--tRNA ligase [Clostridiales bacterium]|jgi:arginyl-tRNA synthetase|nr:arginine--tRNA ligase [Clostridiales bacterium]